MTHLAITVQILFDAQFQNGLFILFEIKAPSVKLLFPFHKRDSFSHDGVGKDHGGMRGEGSLAKGSIDLLKFVAIHLKDMPSIRFKIFDNILRHDLLGHSANLSAIVVDDDSQIIEIIFDCKSPGL